MPSLTWGLAWDTLKLSPLLRMSFWGLACTAAVYTLPGVLCGLPRGLSSAIICFLFGPESSRLPKNVKQNLKQIFDTGSFAALSESLDLCPSRVVVEILAFTPSPSPRTSSMYTTFCSYVYRSSNPGICGSREESIKCPPSGQAGIQGILQYKGQNQNHQFGLGRPQKVSIRDEAIRLEKRQSGRYETINLAWVFDTRRPIVAPIGPQINQFGLGRAHILEHSALFRSKNGQAATLKSWKLMLFSTCQCKLPLHRL